MAYLSKELDKMGLFEKAAYIWTECTRKDDLFENSSMGSLAFNFILWMLR